VSGFASALYAGAVVHRRFRPRGHHLRYRMFQMLLDLDEAPRLAGALRLFSHNAFNLFSFHDRDHGDGRPDLRAWVDDVLGAAGITIAGGSVRILCMPRMLGHVFNPLSLYFCRRADGALAAMIYEVNNTFGQRHSYLIPAVEGAGGAIRQTCAKAFHVSPFMDMAMSYDFQVTAPAAHIATTIEGRDSDGELIIAASFAGRRRAITGQTLLRAFFEYPLLTLKVVAAIHWEAVKLILKGLRVRPVPPAPNEAVTLVSPPSPAIPFSPRGRRWAARAARMRGCTDLSGQPADADPQSPVRPLIRRLTATPSPARGEG